jgi:hypothetical protein
MTSIKDYVEEQNLSNIVFMMIESFEVTIGRKLLDDEIEYLDRATKNVFDTYIVTYDKQEIKFAGPDEKKKIDKIIKQFMLKLTKLITHYIFSRVESYILYKEIKRLRGLKPQS